MSNAHTRCAGGSLALPSGAAASEGSLVLSRSTVFSHSFRVSEPNRAVKGLKFLILSVVFMAAGHLLFFIVPSAAVSRWSLGMNERAREVVTKRARHRE